MLAVLVEPADLALLTVSGKGMPSRNGSFSGIGSGVDVGGAGGSHEGGFLRAIWNYGKIFRLTLDKYVVSIAREHLLIDDAAWGACMGYWENPALV